MSQLPDHDPFPFDDRLRSMYDGDEAAAPEPSARLRVWAGVAPHLPPAAVGGRRGGVRRRAPLMAGLGGLLLGVLLTALLGPWLLGSQLVGMAPATGVIAAAPPASGVSVPVPAVATGASAVAAPAPVGVTREAVAVTPTTEVAPAATLLPVPATVGATPAPVVETPAPVRIALIAGVKGDSAASPETAAVPAVLLPLVQTETRFVALGADTTVRAERRVALLAQRAELVRLRHRTDSLLLALGEPSLLTAAVPTAPDSTPAAQPLTHRWSVALSFAPERNFLGLGAPAADTLAALRRTHEQGRAGYNAALMAEYRLTDRLSVGLGAGLSTYGAELRLTDRRTTVKTETEVSIIESVRDTQFTTTAYSIRIVQEPRLSPVVNFNNQIIGYDTVYVNRNDTVWTYLTYNSTIRSTDHIYTPKITTREEVSTRVLRPNYRFLTLPLQLRYRLTPGGPAARWWADVALGAQLQWFLGGTQLTTADGRTYQTERIGPRGGPFRPFNVALMGSLALNYALTPRLSASLAPTLRYQAESVYKPSTNLTQRPTATGVQLGLKYAF